ncbi:MAG TPA: CHRD domain-containing protein [Phycisphaerae bacterium]|jgi:hypothetical protein
MRRFYLGTILGILAVAAMTPPAAADIHNLTAALTGAQEVPPTPSAGTGSCNITLDDVTGLVTANCTFMGLTSPANAAHIHGLAPPGMNAGILIPLTVTPATSGTVTGSGTLSAANVTGMLNGLTYVNIHTGQFPGGEIRGQIVPEPGSLGLLVIGALALIRRRQA